MTLPDDCNHLAHVTSLANTIIYMLLYRPFFALFYFVFEGNFPSIQTPEGLYSEGRFNGGTYIWRGLFSEFYGMCMLYFWNKVIVFIIWYFLIYTLFLVILYLFSWKLVCSDEIHSCLRTFISNTARTATILNRDNTRRQCSKQYSRQCVETDQFWSLLRVNAQAANTRWNVSKGN